MQGAEAQHSNDSDLAEATGLAEVPEVPLKASFTLWKSVKVSRMLLSHHTSVSLLRDASTWNWFILFLCHLPFQIPNWSFKNLPG